MAKQQFVADLERRWATSPRWTGITRPYTAEDVWRLRGSLGITHTLAEVGAEKLWRLLHEEPYVAALSAVSGGQAVQQIKAGLKAIYISGWQVAGDMNTSLETYPDQSLYPADSVPRLVERINNALLRADELDHMNGRSETDWIAPLVADAEAGFGGLLNAYELMKHMIRGGAAGVHFEDQLASLKKCGHLGGKVLVPTSEFITKLVAARLAADVLDVPTVLIARTDALSANILANDIDPYDREFVIGERTPEGFCRRPSRHPSRRSPADWRTRPTPISCGSRRASPTWTRHGVRGGDPRQVPGEDAGLQLLAVVQLEAASVRRPDRRIPAGAGRDGLQVPVRDPVGLPRA